MTQRRRLSRAQVAATPGREVMPGVSARMRWPDDASRADPAAAVVRLRTMLAEREVRRGIGAALDVALAAEVKRREALRRTGRVLVAWLIGRWRR